MQVKQRAHQKMDFMRNHVRTKVIGPNVPILSLMSKDRPQCWSYAKCFAFVV
jgi:hypothetical protein